MNLKTLLQKGYFPKELPPPFETKRFAEKSGFIKSKWDALLAQKQKPIGAESSRDAKKRYNEDYITKYGSSQMEVYSLGKGIYSRRKLGIPNPKQFLDLSVAIVENWSVIRNVCKQSSYSQSTPVVNEAKRAVRTKSKTWNNFKFELIEKSYDKKIELKLDISQFYPTIYTHSIPWALLGKENAKRFFKIKNTQKTHWENLLLTDINAQNYKKADYIDTLVRNCNDRQSIGLPIGPDTSFILAEMIGNRIDLELKENLKEIPHAGIRYYDDYYFYLDSYDDAQSTLKKVQQVLYEYQLETNESKISINESPFKYTEEWASIISNFKFTKIDKYELREFFSLVNRTLEKNRTNTSWIVHYALGRFEYGNVKVRKEDWSLFLSLLLQILLVDPSNIDQIFKILLSYKVYIKGKSKEQISNVLQKIINEHLTLNHSFEVSWSLWILKSFEIKCPRKLLNNILKSKDTISILICLDIIKSNLFYGGKPGLSELTATITGSQLFTEQWLLAYESYKKQWLNFGSRRILDTNEFMKILMDFGVSFYNETNQIELDFEVKLTQISKKTELEKFLDELPLFESDEKVEQKDKKEVELKSKY